MKNILSACVLSAALALILLAGPSCKKTATKTVTDTLRRAWQLVPYYNSYGSPALSGYNIGDSLFVAGGSFDFVRIPVKTFTGQFGYFLPGTSIYQPANAPAWLDAAAVSFSTTTYLVVESNPPYSQFSTLLYTPKYTPGNYSRFVQSCAYPSLSYPAEAYPLVRDRYILTPVETIGNSYTQVRFDLVSFDSTKLLGAYSFGDTAHVKQITVTADPSTIGFSSANYFCAAYYNKFFVGYGGQFLRFDTAGNVKTFGYLPHPYTKTFGIYNMFTYGNTLFLNSGGIICSSTDQGETWQLFNDFSGTTAGSVIYRNVGRDLYATYPDLDMQIWKVVIVGKAFNFSELNNDGLESTLVTSLTRCGRYIFATTPSGIFYRDTALFNQLKNPIR